MLRYIFVSAVLLTVVAWTNVADAGIFRRGCCGCRGGQCSVGTMAPAAQAQTQAPAAPAEKTESAQVADNQASPEATTAEEQTDQNSTVQGTRRMRRVVFARAGRMRLLGRRFR